MVESLALSAWSPRCLCLYDFSSLLYPSFLFIKIQADMPALPGWVWKLRSPPGGGKTLRCLHPLTLESVTGLLTKRSMTFIIHSLHWRGSPLDHFNIYRGHVRPGGAGERASELMLLLNAASDFAVYFSNASIRVIYICNSLTFFLPSQPFEDKCRARPPRNAVYIFCCQTSWQFILRFVNKGLVILQRFFIIV